MSRIAVIGGAGYLGSVVVDQLRDSDHDVTVVDTGWFLPTSAVHHRRDARDLRACELSGHDTVIHVAGLTDSASCAASPAMVDALNVRLVADLVELCARSGVGRVLLASTAAVYRLTEHAVDESGATDPVDAYSRGKLDAEAAAFAAAEVYDVAVVAIRFGSLYGESPSMRRDLVVNRLVMQAARDGAVCITSSGSSHRPFVHVADGARALRLLAGAELRQRTQVFNCASANSSILAVAQLVAEQMNVSEVSTSTRLDLADYQIDSSALVQLGWVPTWDLPLGIRQLSKKSAPATGDEFRAFRLDHLRAQGALDSELRWTTVIPTEPATRERIPLVSPFRLPDPERAEFDRACRDIVDRAAFRTSDGWSDQAGHLVATSLKLDCEPDGWVVAMLRSGTDALIRALLACGVRPGDRVAVPDLAFHAVASAVLLIRATPVLIDVAADDWCMDPNALQDACSPGSLAAVVGVDNYGTPCDWAGLAEAAHRLGAPLIVDACESLGATRPDGPLVRHADAVVISFSFTKPIHAAGMGGALAVRRERMVGYDPVRWTDAQYALPDINAAHLVLAWTSLERNIERLRDTYARYAQLAHDVGLGTQCEHGRSTRIHAPLLLPDHLAERRDELIETLAARGVTCRAQFPSQSELLGIGAPPPVSKYVADRVLSLPTGAGLPTRAVALVVEEVTRVLTSADFVSGP